MPFILGVFLCVTIGWSAVFSVASYNVENLFDGVNDGSEYPDFSLGNNGWNVSMAEVKFLHTRQAIQAIDADILGLQEIENQRVLKMLAEATGYPYYAFSKADDAPIGIGVLSRYAIITQETLPIYGERTRPLLHVKIATPDEPVHLWVNHWPSLKHPESLRLKVAKQLYDAVKQVKEPTILLGDFNTPITQNSVIRRQFSDLFAQGWYDPWSEMPLQRRWSHDFFGKKSALDRILLSNLFFDAKGLDYAKGSFDVLSLPLLTTKEGKPYRWGRKDKGKGVHTGEGYSDHFPIKLKLSTTPYKTSTTVFLEDLFSMQEGPADVSLKEAVVSYVHKDGFVLSQKGRGIYVYRSGATVRTGQVVDVSVRMLKEYYGMKEITALHVDKLHPYTVPLKHAMLPASSLSEARAGDVIYEITGIVRQKMLHTKHGTIRLYAKEPRLMPQEGERVQLKKVRVGLFKNKKELILEERE